MASTTTPTIAQQSLTITYQIDKSTDDVEISLTFGPLGIATMTKVKLDGTILANGQVGSFDLIIGENKDLDNKFLSFYIIETVTSATAVPANVNVTITLTGGVEPYSHQLSHLVSQPGGSVIFLGDVYLTQSAF